MINMPRILENWSYPILSILRSLFGRGGNGNSNGGIIPQPRKPSIKDHRIWVRTKKSPRYLNDYEISLNKQDLADDENWYITTAYDTIMTLSIKNKEGRTVAQSGEYKVPQKSTIYATGGDVRFAITIYTQTPEDSYILIGDADIVFGGYDKEHYHITENVEVYRPSTYLVGIGEGTIVLTQKSPR